jgi:hypothetical protein
VAWLFGLVQLHLDQAHYRLAAHRHHTLDPFAHKGLDYKLTALFQFVFG